MEDVSTTDVPHNHHAPPHPPHHQQHQHHQQQNQQHEQHGSNHHPNHQHQHDTNHQQHHNQQQQQHGNNNQQQQQQQQQQKQQQQQGGNHKNTQIPKIKPMFVDIHEQYDYSLLKRFYDELMIPNFPMEDELEPLESWVKMFTEGEADESEEDGTKEHANVESPDFHVVIALNPATDSAGNHAILGGVVYEYYRTNNCGCLTYLLVSENYRGKGLAADLIHQAVGSLENNAKTRGHLAGCNAIFLETNSAEKVSAADDVMDPSVRHRVFHRLGFRLVDFDYVQPPLSTEVKKCRTLLLTVLITPHIPKQTVGTEEKFYIPSALVTAFIRAFWDSCCTRLGYRFWTTDVDYVRMMDQLSRRSRVPLLDLPWDRPWYLVDLREHYDLELLVRFYQDVLAPNFHRRAELEPLESWLRMLPRYPGARKQKTQNVQKAQNMPDFHVLLSLIYPQDDTPSAPIIAGGLAFEYYSGTNCGLLTYLIVRHGNAERMGRALTRRAVEILDADATQRGHVAGCNAIFLESPSSVPQGLRAIPLPHSPLSITSEPAITHPSTTAETFTRTPTSASIQAPISTPPNLPQNNTTSERVLPPPSSASSTFTPAGTPKPQHQQSFQEMEENMKYEEISHQHVLLSKIGWRLVDFGYVPPPLTYEGKRVKTGSSLLTLFTNRIPSEEMHGGSRKYYLPKALLLNFVTEFWSSSAARVQYDYTSDEDFKKMREDLSRREKVPLLDLPWERPWTLIDLSLDYDRTLLASYYTTLLLPNSPRPEKHEPLEHWQSMLESQNPHFHVVLALDNSSKIVGGLTFEYYDEVNCGFLTYLNVSGERVYDMGRLLVVYAVSILDQDAQARGHIAGCNSIFLETLATLPSHFKEHDLTQNHTALWRMGFRLVDIDYVQPPLANGLDSTKNLSLTILLTPRIPHIPHEEGGYVYNYLPNPLLLNFITTQWHTAAQRLGNKQLLKDPDYLRMADQISRRSKIPLYDTPWERSWTAMDMREDFDIELLTTFYDAIPNKDELEPLDHWVRMLTPEGKNDPRTEDLHVLLALKYSNTSRIRPDVVGGLTFEYFPITNCGFLTYLMVPSSGTESEVMGRELVEEAVEVLDQNARDRGHVVGFNVIFMESALDPRPQPAQASAPGKAPRIYMDFSHHHTMLHKIGWRALDFFFVQPPLSPKSKAGKPTLLTAFLSPTIPRDDAGNHFIPASLLRSFITAYWTNTCGRVGYPYKNDPLYKKMMHDLHERVRIPLVDLRDRLTRPKL